MPVQDVSIRTSAARLHRLLADYSRKGLKSEHLEFLIGAASGDLPVIPDGFPGKGDPGFRVWVTIEDDEGDHDDFEPSSGPGPLHVTLPMSVVKREPLLSFLKESFNVAGEQFVWVPFDAIKEAIAAKGFRGETVIGDDFDLWLGRFDEDAADDAAGEMGGWIKPLKPEYIAQRLVFLPLAKCPPYFSDPFFDPIKVEEDLHIVWDVYLNWLSGDARGTAPLTDWDQEFGHDPALGRVRTAKDEVKDIQATIFRRLWKMAADLADREDFRRVGLNPEDGSVPDDAITHVVEYMWKDTDGNRHRESWKAVAGTFSLNAAIKVAEGDRYRHLPEDDRTAREHRILEAGARNTIYNLRLGTEAEALAGSGDIARLVDHLGLWIREDTDEDYLHHRKAFIDAAWRDTAAESTHMSSVADVAKAYYYHEIDPDNAPSPQAVAVKAVTGNRVRPGATVADLLKQARKYYEQMLVEEHENRFAQLPVLDSLPPVSGRLLRWVTNGVNKIIELLDTGISLGSLPGFGPSHELGLLELLLWGQILFRVLPQVFHLVERLSICGMLFVTFGVSFILAAWLGNWLREKAYAGLEWRMVVVAVFGVLLGDLVIPWFSIAPLIRAVTSFATRVSDLQGPPATPTSTPVPWSG